jgi:signal transduction histidine kinase/CheY-like chemotaxis protein
MFQFITFAVCLLCIVNEIFNFQYNLPVELLYATASCGIVSIVFFGISRFYKFSQVLAFTYLLSILILFSFAWFFEGGVNGPVVIFILFLVVIAIFLTDGLLLYTFLLLVFVTVIGLYYVQRAYPKIIFGYKDYETQQMDILFSTVFSISFLGSLVIYVKNSYNKKQKLLNEHKTALEESNKKLQEARDIAEKATYSKSYFLANMSHEIRTPLNGIIGITELLKQQKIKEEEKELINTLQSCCDLLLNIINDVLDVSKIEAGQLILKPTAFQISNTINTVVAITSAQIRNSGKQLAISVEVENGIQENVLGDENRLKQILVNLISNAIKFTQLGEIKIKLVKEVVTADREIITFHISDTGIGIEKADIQLLFQPFSQIQHNHKREYGGTGLGLSICKKLVEMMGGNIWVTSEVGVGSTFSFTLPLTINKENVVEDAFQNLGQQHSFKKLPIILLAEDNPMNQFVSKKIFSSLGYTIDIAENGLEVLSMMNKKQYDIIFMDVQMPQMDGIEATKKIMSLSSEKMPIIIAMTANALKEDEQLCFEVGMNDFLAKPFTIQQLKAVLNRWIS